MNREKVLWWSLSALAVIFLAWRAFLGAGSVYVRPVVVKTVDPQIEFQQVEEVLPNQKAEPGVRLSWSRTLGVWIAGLLTLSILSFLYRDNPAYRLAEAIFVGTSAGYVMVAGFWEAIVQKLLAKLIPVTMRGTFLPDLNADAEPDYFYFVPLFLGILLLWRLMPKGGWISRWPIAFFIGALAGLRMVNVFGADFIGQIRATLLPLVAFTSQGEFDPAQSTKNLLLIVGVLSTLVYFFFSWEHRGVVGKISRLGIWYLMIAFGASFAYTVMARVVLITARLEFVFDDWLWLIDPLGRR